MAKKDKMKSKKLGFFKRQKEKLDRKKRERKNLQKNFVSPVKQLRSLSVEQIQEHLEESPLLHGEPELAEFRFNPELVVKYTQASFEKYKKHFEKADRLTIQQKLQLYEDFCIETTSKLISKALLVSIQRRLRLISRRLKDAGETKQMMRAIVTEATLNIPQFPIESHPLIVGMYEEVRRETMGDSFTIPGFEDIFYWKQRVEIDRRNAATVTCDLLNREAVLEKTATVTRFSAIDGEEGAYLVRRSETGDPTSDEPPSNLGKLSIGAEQMVFVGNSATDAADFREILSELFSEDAEEVQREDSYDYTEDEDNDEEAEVTPEDVAAAGHAIGDEIRNEDTGKRDGDE